MRWKVRSTSTALSPSLSKILRPPGLNEDIVRFISAKKSEPEWMLAWRLDAFQRWQTMEEPTWALVHYPPIDYQAARYYAAPKPARSIRASTTSIRDSRDLQEARHPAPGSRSAAGR